MLSVTMLTRCRILVVCQIDVELNNADKLRNIRWMSNQEGSDECESRDVHVTISAHIFDA
jgi:hypothetical protein